MTSPKLLSMAQSAKTIRIEDPRRAFARAFARAIAAGLFEEWDDLADNWVGHFMYMFTCPVAGDAFKHTGTRQYVYNPKAGHQQ